MGEMMGVYFELIINCFESSGSSTALSDEQLTKKFRGLTVLNYGSSMRLCSVFQLVGVCCFVGKSLLRR